MDRLDEIGGRIGPTDLRSNHRNGGIRLGDWSRCIESNAPQEFKMTHAADITWPGMHDQQCCHGLITPHATSDKTLPQSTKNQKPAFLMV
jgi:hypothetical protein